MTGHRVKLRCEDSRERDGALDRDELIEDRYDNIP